MTVSISFNSIPSNMRVPGWLAEMDNTAANTGASGAKRVLLLGEKLGDGSQDVLTTSVPINSEQMAMDLFGKSSMLHRMARAWLKSNSSAELYAMPIEYSTAANATGSLTVSGTTTADGTLHFYIGGEYHEVDVDKAKSSDDIATAIASSITSIGTEVSSGTLTKGQWYEITGVDGTNPAAFATAGASSAAEGVWFQSLTELQLDVEGATGNKVKPLYSSFPVLARVDETEGSQVNFTAKHGGALGSDIDIRLNYYGALGGEVLPEGISVSFVAMNATPVTANPSIASALAALGSTQYYAIICPYNNSDNLNSLRDEMNARWGYLEQSYGHAFSAMKGTHGALMNYGESRNDESITLFGFYSVPTNTEEVLSACAGVAVQALAIDPARPVHTLPVSYVKAPYIDDHFSKSENNQLLWKGVTPLAYSSTNSVQLSRVITTYQTNTSGEADNSYLDVTTRYTLQAVTEYMRSWIMSKYPRVKLVADGTPIPEGHAAVTPKDIAGELIAAYKKLMQNVVVQNLDAFKSQLLVAINGTDPNRLDIEATPILAGQLDVIAFKNKFYLRFDG